MKRLASVRWSIRAQDFLQLAKADGLRVRHILETQVHSDFVSGARELKACLGD